MEIVCTSNKAISEPVYTDSVEKGQKITEQSLLIQLKKAKK